MKGPVDAGPFTSLVIVNTPGTTEVADALVGMPPIGPTRLVVGGVAVFAVGALWINCPPPHQMSPRLRAWSSA